MTAIEIGKQVPIKVKVTVAGDEMTIDLTDMSPQVRGYLQFGPHHRLWLHPGRL